MFKKVIKKIVSMKEARVKKRLIALFGEEQSKLQIFEDIQTSENILAAISKIKDDDPSLVVQWNFDAFNNINNSRDADPSHTITNLIEYIKNSGGEDLYDKHTIFMFQTEREFFDCVHNLPDWSRRIPGIPDVASSLKINCNTGNYDIARFDLAFNWP